MSFSMNASPFRLPARSVAALAIALWMSVALPARADFDGELLGLQSRWAQIKYELPVPQREAALAVLAESAEHLTERFPNRAEAWTWAGIIHSTWAGERGGLGALGTVKQARRDFERAIAIDAQTLQGSALTSLGSLYHAVPGWPVSFGDDERARELLQRGLAAAPAGIDANYFYAQFLLDSGDIAGARQHARQALDAAPRPGRESADAGRREEVRSLLAEIDRQDK